MANTAVIDQILTIFRDFFAYVAPIIGVMAGLSFIFTFLVSITLGLGRRTFRG